MSPSLSPTGFKFDIASLLAPVTAEKPCGEYLLYEGTYDRIQDARREDDASLDRGVWKQTMKRSDWSAVEATCIQALEEYTKDLQIAAWLLEAWLQMHGFAGLREGLSLMNGLVREFWDGIYPPIQDGDTEFRVGPFVWVNDKIPTAIKLTPITLPDAPDLVSYSWADWEQACRVETTLQRTASKDEKLTQARFQQSALLTSSEYLLGQVQTLESAMRACSDLGRELEAKLNVHAPSLQQVTAALEPIHGLLTGLLSQRRFDPVAPPPEDHPRGLSALTSDSSEGRTTSSEGPVRNRAEAYRRLAEAAEFLLRTEPHSPTPYLVKRAIAWGSMSLEELLPQLVRNGAELTEVYRLLQIDKKP